MVVCCSVMTDALHANPGVRVVAEILQFRKGGPTKAFACIWFEKTHGRDAVFDVALQFCPWCRETITDIRLDAMSKEAADT